MLSVECVAGSTFDLDVDCPADWDVASVTTLGARAMQPIAEFRVSATDRPDRRRLTINLGQSLASDANVELLIRAVAAAPPWGQSLSLPVPHVLQATEVGAARIGTARGC